MSRSYREPWVTDGYKGSKHRQFEKKQANRAVRKTEEVPNGKGYRKVFDPWNICDYRWYESEKSMKKWCTNPWKYNRK